MKMRPLDFKPTLKRGYVYGIRCGEFVKIGKATDIEQRLHTFRLCNPYPCEVVFRRRTEAPLHFERKMRELLAEWSVGREWFRITDNQITEAASVAAVHAKTVMAGAIEWEREILAKKGSRLGF